MTDQEKKQKQLEQNRKAVKKYSEKTLTIATKYYPTDIQDGKRLKAYLAQTGQSANSYIKALIKADLDSKGFNVDNAAIDTMDMDSNANTDSTDMP